MSEEKVVVDDAIVEELTEEENKEVEENDDKVEDAETIEEADVVEEKLKKDDINIVTPIGNGGVIENNRGGTDSFYQPPTSKPLFAQYGLFVNSCMLIGFVINTGVLLFSHLGVSAIIFTSLLQDGIDVEADFVGACSNVGDLEAIAPGEPIFDETNVLAFQLGLGCIPLVSPDFPIEQCVQEAFQDQFGTSNDCSLCLVAYTDCLQQPECLDLCRLQSPLFTQEACEECSDKNCEFDFVVCSGINIIEDRTEDACLNDPDFADGTDARTDVALYVAEIAEQCFSDESFNRCFKSEVIDRFGLGDDCSDCLEKHALCVLEECSPVCDNPVTDLAACETCITATRCAGEVQVCTGFDVYAAGGRLLQDEDSNNVSGFIFSDEGLCLDKEQFNIFEALRLTFIDSIAKAAQGGSLFLALFIGIASGAWPYTKIILMIICWYVPIKLSTRKLILRILAILGKWSLVDVFAVVLIANGLLVQKILPSGLPLVLFTEPRAGIYAFGIAAILALVQGEIIRYLDYKKDKNEESKFMSKTVNTFDVVTAKRFNALKALMTFCLIISTIVATVSAGLVQLEMNNVGRIEERPGPNTYFYAGWNMSLALVDDCILHEDHGSVAGAYFLAILFYILVIIIPVLVPAMMLIASCCMNATPSSFKKLFFATAFTLSNFAALDVWAVTLFIFSNQFAGLIRGAVGDDVTCGLSLEEVAAGEVCIGLEGEVKLGGILLPIAVITFWIAQCAGTQIFAIISR